MSEKIEGTFVLDGLIEGSLYGMGDAREMLREWVESAAADGVRLNMQFDGDTFSLLADTRPVAVARFGGAPSGAIRELLGGLLRIFPPSERAHVFSTLRSTEYRPGELEKGFYRPLNRTFAKALGVKLKD